MVNCYFLILRVVDILRHETTLWLNKSQIRMFSEWKQVCVGMEPSKPTQVDGNDTTTLSHHHYILYHFANYDLLVVCIGGSWKALGFVNEATFDLVLLAALKQFEDQATNRLLLAVLEEYEDSGTTQKKEVKTPTKTTLSTLSKHYNAEMYNMHFCCKRP